jgi:hypothetical protein
MQYPLNMRFKILGLAPQIYVTDASGATLYYVKQKMFKLKEAVKVFHDDSRSELLYEIKADRIIDFSAKYNFTDTDGQNVGAVGRKGMKSLFRATYLVYDEDTAVMTVSEESVWKRILENTLGGIPLLGFVIIMLINPSYIVKSTAGEALFRLTKLPAFFEGKFAITKLKDDLSPQEETRAVLSMLMLSLLERKRG